MKTILQTHTIRLQCLLTAAVVIGLSLCAVAEEPRLLIEYGHIADGYVADMVQGPDCTFIVSGEYWPAGSNHEAYSDRIPHIAVLDSAGKILRRVNPLSIFASSQRLNLRWRVRAALSDGSYIVDGDLTNDDGSQFRLPRSRLAQDGTLIFDYVLSYSPLPTGPVAAQKNGGVLFGRSSRDRQGRAIERWRFDREPTEPDSSFAENVFAAWPVSNLLCVRLAVTEDDRIWAWLGVKGGRGRLFRFLSDGRVDPTFQPSKPVETVETVGFEDQWTWLGLLPGGGVLVVAQNDQAGVAIRRLRSDGTTDASFGWPFNDAVATYPLMTFPDGSLLVNRASDGDPSRLAGLLKIAPNGSLDPTWQSQLPPQWPEILKVVRQSDGRLMVLQQSLFLGYWSHPNRLSRLNPDGSRDTTFDGSVVSPSPVPAVHLLASGLLPGQRYSFEERDEIGSTENLTGELQLLPNQRQPIELLERVVGSEMPRHFWILRQVNQP
jgi:hypothetical protein